MAELLEITLPAKQPPAIRLWWKLLNLKFPMPKTATARMVWRFGKLGGMSYSKIHDAPTAILFAGHVHDNEIYNIDWPVAGFDPNYHTNLAYLDQWNGNAPVTPAYFYNNRIHDWGNGASAFTQTPTGQKQFTCITMLFMATCRPKWPYQLILMLMAPVATRERCTSITTLLLIMTTTRRVFMW